MRKIEILAPAGSFEALKAAINGGCDAVYVGGSMFGARAYANNFNQEELVEAIHYVHMYGKQLYLTVNTLLKEDELKQELLDYLKVPYEAGLDAVIVQDVGVMHFIHKHFKNLPIHASTQMTLTMANGANLLKEYGVNRMVTSRELSLEEIKAIRDNTDLEIESFVHGALCYCYSGQCFMSSMLGGRSGNRGRCAQTCRMPYELVKDDKVISDTTKPYLLSPKDMCTIDIIPELVESGIDSFKIEGRMKRPEYTAFVAHTYRKYVDLYQSLGEKKYRAYIKEHQAEYDKDVANMMELYNRGNSSHGYYEMHNGKNMMSMARPNHNGMKVGTIQEVSKGKATFVLERDIQAQDVLEFRGKNDEKYDYTVKDGVKAGNRVTANYKHGLHFEKGDGVFRTKNNQLLDEIGAKFIEENRKIPMSGIFFAALDEPLMLTLRVRDIEVTVSHKTASKAMKQPMTEEKVRAQLNKTNTSMFEFEELDIYMGDDLFIPVGFLNELRRMAVEQLMEAIIAPYERKAENCELQELSKKTHFNGETGIVAAVSNEAQLKAVLAAKEVDCVYYRMDDYDLKEVLAFADPVKKAGKKYFLILPHIFRKDIYDRFENDYERLGANAFDAVDGFVIKNLEEYEFLQRHDLLTKDMILDYNLYTLNEEAKQFWAEKKITHTTVSIELNYSEMRELGCEDSDLFVYGYLPLMTSAQCVVKNNIGCTKKKDRYYLKDRYNKNFVVVNHCKNCYNSIYNADPVVLLKEKKDITKLHPRNLRLDFTLENEEETKKILDAYIDVYCKDLEVTPWMKHFTKGHFRRGIE
ncbi:protease [Lachnospiraceae bacterium KM106-2]|nr:protease [Lachnospiraceae bacterium KM106-2]